ncbi:MAG: J domain-containing protein [Alphaproteobacteria bacterium]|nr:J domain-containing protein [Alphaproteobacteria bacterium]
MAARDEDGEDGARAVRKVSYSIPCASAFRDRVAALAERRGVNVGDVARSVILTLPAALIDGFPDPGEPARDDRETVILKSGPSAGKPWKRKPRLQARLPKGHQVVRLRKALGLALALDAGELTLSLDDAKRPARAEAEAALREEADRLRAMVRTLAFDALPDGVRTRDEALFVLGFAPGARPAGDLIKARYRMLAAVLHPDSGLGDNARMAQLNAAMSFLRRAP